MTEITPETHKSEKKTFGTTLIGIGNTIKELSANEVENKKVIATLGVVGVATIAVAAGQAVEGAKLARLADSLNHLAELASGGEQYSMAANLYNESAQASFGAADKFWNVSKESVLVASQLAVIMGIDIARYVRDGEGIAALQGKTKVSTHAGPALANIFIKCGESLNKKTS